jgi:hypothetical protein
MKGRYFISKNNKKINGWMTKIVQLLPAYVRLPAIFATSGG